MAKSRNQLFCSLFGELTYWSLQMGLWKRCGPAQSSQTAAKIARIFVHEFHMPNHNLSGAQFVLNRPVAAK
jgi:hypothetical protein